VCHGTLRTRLSAFPLFRVASDPEAAQGVSRLQQMALVDLARWLEPLGRLGAIWCFFYFAESGYDSNVRPQEHWASSSSRKITLDLVRS
jgi:hypothetical protein